MFPSSARLGRDPSKLCQDLGPAGSADQDGMSRTAGKALPRHGRGGAGSIAAPASFPGPPWTYTSPPSPNASTGCSIRPPATRKPTPARRPGWRTCAPWRNTPPTSSPSSAWTGGSISRWRQPAARLHAYAEADNAERTGRRLRSRSRRRLTGSNPQRRRPLYTFCATLDYASAASSSSRAAPAVQQSLDRRVRLAPEVKSRGHRIRSVLRIVGVAEIVTELPNQPDTKACLSI